MSLIPTLTEKDLRNEVQDLLEREREHHLFAFFGRGVEGTIRIDDAPEPLRNLPVVSIHGEIELRQRLLELPEEGAKGVFLVPFRHRLPMDLAGRFALDGRVRTIGRDARLAALFDARGCDSAAMKSPLSEYLLGSGAGRISKDESLSCGSSWLTEQQMWSTWLARTWNLGKGGDLALDTLLVWAATDGRGGAFREQLADQDAVVLGAERFLQERVGHAAVAALRLWQKGKGKLALAAAVLFDAVLDVEPLAVWVRTLARTLLGVEGESEPARVARELAAVVSTALPLYERAAASSERAPLRALFEQAESLAEDPEVAQALVNSRWLPSGWALRLDRLGSALEAGAKSPDAATLNAALAAKRELESHVGFRDDANEERVRQGEMAVRLLAWLASDRSDIDPSSAQHDYEDVERLGRWYAEEGGFVDWARRVARGSRQSGFDRGVAAVVERADEEREKLDARFAAALPSWIVARRPSQRVLPIDHVAKRVIGRFLDGHDERRLLVLLLDGMAWAQAAEILDDLGAHVDGWAPAAFHGQNRVHRLGDSRYPVVLAGFPTVTEVSRSAFFAGKPTPPGRKHQTSDDRERFRDNAAIRPFVDASDYARLFLRGDGHDAHGVASREALTEIASSERRVVGVVINAIDASLKGDTQARHPWCVANIRSLGEFLQAAKEAGRAVLLASDHGHVPADRFESSAGAVTGGARWRPLKAGSESVESYEIALSGEGVWAPKGAEGVALLTDDRRRYGGGAHAGEHGGATMAEVVAPCVVIHWEDSQISDVDAERAPQGYVKPGWWHFDVLEPAPEVAPDAAAEPTPERRAKRKTRDETAQLPLGFESPPEAPETEAPPASTRTPPSPITAALSALPGFNGLPAAEQKRVASGVQYLLARSGIAQLGAFASHLGLPEFRVQGFVAQRLQKLLNVDGFQVVTYSAHELRLDAAMLEQQFGVKL